MVTRNFGIFVNETGSTETINPSSELKSRMITTQIRNRDKREVGKRQRETQWKFLDLYSGKYKGIQKTRNSNWGERRGVIRCYEF
jgi:hypothetical protein